MCVFSVFSTVFFSEYEVEYLQLKIYINIIDFSLPSRSSRGSYSSDINMVEDDSGVDTLDSRGTFPPPPPLLAPSGVSTYPPPPPLLAPSGAGTFQLVTFITSLR